MFDFVDTSGLPEWARVVVEPDTRRDPGRDLVAPVSVVAGSVVDAVAVLVERGVVADPGSDGAGTGGGGGSGA